MSAVARQWDVPAGAGGQRHLRSVPTGPGAHGGGPRVGVRVEPAGLRLTGRGRRLLGVLLAVGLLLGGGLATRAWASTPPRPPRSVVVHSGDTLSGVAHRAYPSMQVSDAVTKVALANDLNSLQVVAGQHLLLPH